MPNLVTLEHDAKTGLRVAMETPGKGTMFTASNGCQK
jgi:hypothetical protein